LCQQSAKMSPRSLSDLWNFAVKNRKILL